MFTGIIENMAEVIDVQTNKNNLDILFKCDLQFLQLELPACALKKIAN